MKVTRPLIQPIIVLTHSFYRSDTHLLNLIVTSPPTLSLLGRNSQPAPSLAFSGKISSLPPSSSSSLTSAAIGASVLLLEHLHLGCEESLAAAKNLLETIKVPQPTLVRFLEPHQPRSNITARTAAKTPLRV
ncbi:hypothetical protein LXL04_020379 [Taraxacum kok-saghyz]